MGHLLRLGLRLTRLPMTRLNRTMLPMQIEAEEFAWTLSNSLVDNLLHSPNFVLNKTVTGWIVHSFQLSTIDEDEIENQSNFVNRLLSCIILFYNIQCALLSMY